ncbi:putative quinate permease [Colletotrichum viniferum]|nr:putative quinate permease [Colletotrichum viniferum]
MRNIFSLHDDPGSDTPKEVYGYRPYILAFSASWASAMYGYDSAFIGGTINLLSFQRAYGLGNSSADQIANLSSNIVSTFQAGTFFGYGGRALTGPAIGASSALMPVYIAECSPALIRGRLVGIFEIMLQTALVFGFWVNYGVAQNISSQGNTQWHVPVTAQFVPAGLLLITIPLFCSESPRWLVTKNRTTQARKALSWVRNLPEDHEYISREIVQIEVSITLETEANGGEQSTRKVFRELLVPGIRWRVSIGALLMVLQNLTGINAINYYSPTILRSIGFSGTHVGLLATGVYGIVKMMTTLVFMVFFVDRFGRRPALLIGVLLSWLFRVVRLIRSWNGIPWIFASEALPNRVRTLGMMIAVCAQWLAQFIVVYSLPHMINKIKWGTFLFFGACTVVAFIFAFLFVPETKGVPLEDMDMLLGADAPLFAKAAREGYLKACNTGLSTVVRHLSQEKEEQVQKEYAEGEYF